MDDGVIYITTKSGFIPKDTFVAFWQTGQTQSDADATACSIAEGMRMCQGIFVPEPGGGEKSGEGADIQEIANPAESGGGLPDGAL